MPIQPYILMLAGHVDHGKTALVKALTGVDLDRLPEEKKRGLTIDLGFTVLELSEGRYRLGIIDVPGHADFIKNMVAGTGGVDIGLLVVAADDGWMPQTEEHFQILTYLGVKRLIVAVNKADLDQELTALVVEQVREQLAETAYAQAPIIPTSAVQQMGLNPLRAALVEVLENMPEPDDFGRARIFIDRVFTVIGQGRVVTGTLQGGALQEGQSLKWFPFEETVRVRSLQSHGRELSEVCPGTRVAVNLSTVAGNKHSLDKLERGQLLTDSGPVEASQVIDVLLIRSGRVDHVPKKGLRPLKHDTRVRIHIGSSNIAAQLILLEASDLLPGEQALARLKLKCASVFLLGDRFIVRDWSEQTTLCGGAILDPLPPKRMSPRRGSQNVYLKTLAKSSLTSRAFLVALVKRDFCLNRKHVEWRFPISRDEFAALCEREEEAGFLRVCGEWLVENKYWEQGLSIIKKMIHLHHKEEPQEAGLLLSSLKNRFLKDQRKIPMHLFLETLEQEGYLIEDTFICERNHLPHLTERFKEVEAGLLRVLSRDTENPIEIDQDANDQVRVLRYLLQKQSIIQIGDRGYLLKQAYNEKIKRVVSYLNKNKSARVSELKEAAKLSRKYLIPFLESLDKQGITVRQGDLRSLGSVD
ncbi:MAG: selenocysteine-specific translation elongation factor [Verrucomicrobia bacterium]|nr:selenocysteine-specific translation elongation factor [Verrucomicrobiota bacterium]